MAAAVNSNSIVREDLRRNVWTRFAGCLPSHDRQHDRKTRIMAMLKPREAGNTRSCLRDSVHGCPFPHSKLGSKSQKFPPSAIPSNELRSQINNCGRLVYSLLESNICGDTDGVQVCIARARRVAEIEHIDTETTSVSASWVNQAAQTDELIN